MVRVAAEWVSLLQFSERNGGRRKKGTTILSNRKKNIDQKIKSQKNPKKSAIKESKLIRKRMPRRVPKRVQKEFKKSPKQIPKRVPKRVRNH